ncbi:MAG: alpha-L-fucosidase [Bacteroidota bacterium]
MNKRFFLSIFIALSCNTSFAQNAPAPYGALPTKYQLEWQDMETYMFIHFGPNTFTDKEWGHGDEDPKVFNPKKLDARQWVRTAKAAGMKGIIITAKHHDGFALYPSKYSTHTVRESAWKDGKGDVLKELSAACKEYGVKFGVYLSPWDRNHPKYGTSEYNQIFANMLEEVHTQYGPVFEQWFDGAKGEGEKSQTYDFPLFNSIVYKHNPQAIIFSDVGPGTRWMGNEDGIVGETNWSTLNADGFGPGADAPPRKSLNEGDFKGKYWLPAEVDVSIRPGWFYSPSTDNKVKSLKQLVSIYQTSVGRNGNLLLNVPVDRDGLIHVADSTRLMEFRKYLDAAYKNDLAKGKKVTANGLSRGKLFSPMNLTDGKPNTYWAPPDGMKNSWLTLDLGKQTEINQIILQENLKLGQRVREFSIMYWDGKAYREVASQTTIGHKRIISFPTLKTSRLKVYFSETQVAPALSNISVYKVPDL